MRRLEKRVLPMNSWKSTLGFFRISAQWLYLSAVCAFPPGELKNALLRAAGVRVGKNAAIAPGAVVDRMRPRMLSIGNAAVIGYEALLLTHEWVGDEFRWGKTSIGDGATVGARSVVLAGVTIGPRAVVAAGSVVNKDVPAGALVAGVPAKAVRK
jgi:acetyltransferase-like isoleucine patch superfamily enzyme